MIWIQQLKILNFSKFLQYQQTLNSLLFLYSPFQGTPYSGYTTSSSPTQNCPNSSAPNSLPSHLHTSRQSYNFWKASGSQSPLTSASSINSFFRPSVHSRGCFRRTLHQIWRFLKWPLGLLLICSLLGLVVYFLVVGK